MELKRLFEKVLLENPACAELLATVEAAGCAYVIESINTFYKTKKNE